MGSSPCIRVLALFGAVALAATVGIAAPAYADQGAVTSLTFAPDVVVGGEATTGTVTLAAPATEDTMVSLQNFAPVLMSVPASVTVPAGATTATTANGSTTSGMLNVSPQPGTPGSDVVRIKRAEWKDRMLRIEATSTNPQAVLVVFFASSPNAAEFTLTNNGGGRYSTQRPWLDNPLPIIVRSTFGGTATSGR